MQQNEIRHILLEVTPRREMQRTGQGCTCSWRLRGTSQAGNPALTTLSQ